MKAFTTVILALAIIVCTANAWAGSVGSAVDVRIVTDDGRTLSTYPVKMHHGTHKVYAEAVKGDHYRIEVKNLQNRRVGLVIAVDGRNIISGTKSWLKNNERMYILEPYGSGQFSGWRTSQDRVNRFFFTDAPDSYAAAFGDGSAMGVIAVATYAEVQRHVPMPLSQTSPGYERSREGKAAGAADKSSLPAAASALGAVESMKKKADRSERMQESAGTGYGRDEYSPSQVVAFEPEKRAVETIYVKYEWRSTLCKLGVVNCAKPPCRPHNRFWNDYGYASPPPRHTLP
ncbi:MAG: hypothetical protein WCJ37_06260 [Syntrophus sp. (in: bacteria)]